MAVRVVRLGSAREKGEGLRIGTVRRPPRGVPNSELASQDWYDVWFPNLAPSAATVKLGQGSRTPAMAKPENRHALELLAALSHRVDFSVGCYCEDESRCHRSLLRALLAEHGAATA